MATKAQTLLAEAIQDLNINNPVLNYKIKGDTVTIWFLAYTEPVRWSRPEAPETAKPAPKRTRKASA
jgi:hypothetical protein